MRAHVRAKVARQREALATALTRERFLARVDEQVVLQVGLLREATRADRAAKRPRAIVHMQMTPEVAGRRKALRTLRALVRLVLREQNRVR